MSQTLTPIAAETPRQSLRAVLRHPPELTPEDSLQRFAQVMRFEPMGMLAVTSHGRLFGIIAQTDVLPILRVADRAGREAEMLRPVAEFMRPAVAVLRADMDLKAAGRIFAESGQTMLPVLDDRDCYLGSVSSNDLLAPDLPAPRPARIGGMATPFGVYLSDGTVQAGVSNWALMASGAMMTMLYLVSMGALDGIFRLISWAAGRPIPFFVTLADDVPSTKPWVGLATIGGSLLMFVVFMVLMRFTRLAGYHAAEHQTVHALERFEPLVPEVVRRMPRAHPRCGTNLMAALIVFWYVRQALEYVPLFAGMVEFMAAAAALFVWRPFGTFLQERFTTRPANPRELASGIAAGNQLMARYLESAPVRPSLGRRIWCSGMLQVMLGSAPLWAIIALLPYLEQLQRFVTRH